MAVSSCSGLKTPQVHIERSFRNTTRPRVQHVFVSSSFALTGLPICFPCSGRCPGTTWAIGSRPWRSYRRWLGPLPIIACCSWEEECQALTALNVHRWVTRAECKRSLFQGLRGRPICWLQDLEVKALDAPVPSFTQKATTSWEVWGWTLGNQTFLWSLICQWFWREHTSEEMTADLGSGKMETNGK